MSDWQTKVPVDCVFLDQIGARPWLRDFNPASPTPTSYDDGWLAMLATYSDRCVMVEDGWDRLARDAVGFHGSLLMMSRELDLPNAFFGAGNWQPYPLATWLFHDKVLLYQHDLYDGTMAIDLEVLTWNMAFGLVSSYSWDELGPATNPWLDLVARLQRDFGPHYVGVPLSGYRNLAPRREREHVRRPRRRRESRSASRLLDRRLRPRAGRLPRADDGERRCSRGRSQVVRRRAALGGGALRDRRARRGERDRAPAGRRRLRRRGRAACRRGAPAAALTATALAADGTTLGTRRRPSCRTGSSSSSMPGTMNGRAVAAYRVSVGGP